MILWAELVFFRIKSSGEFHERQEMFRLAGFLEKNYACTLKKFRNCGSCHISLYKESLILRDDITLERFGFKPFLFGRGLIL